MASPPSLWYKNPDVLVIFFLFAVSALASCLELGWRPGLMVTGGILYLVALTVVLLHTAAGGKSPWLAFRPHAALLVLYVLAYGTWVLSLGQGMFLVLLSAGVAIMASVIRLFSLSTPSR